MELADKKKPINKIYFKYSVTEISDNQRTQAIKSILDTVDLLVDDQAKRKKIRKVVLDNINDLHRVFVNIINSLVNNGT